MIKTELSTTASVIKLVLTVAVFVGIAYAVNFLIRKAVNEVVRGVLTMDAWRRKRFLRPRGGRLRVK